MKRNKTLLFTINKKGHSKENPDLLRIICSPEYTKIDFGYTAKSKYESGGWIRMEKSTFIEIIETKERLVLTSTSGIPINPEYHYFESTKDWRYFSLFFPPIPQKDCSLNIIEKENGNKNDFNYYNVLLNMADGVEVYSN
jgi:hypothetical protein